VASSSRADEGTRWSVRVSETGKDTANVFVRKHQFTVGAAAQFDEDARQVSGLEYVLGVVGAELVNGITALARSRRIEIDRAEAVVQGELNDPLAYLGVIGAAGHAGIERIAAKVYLSSLDDEATLRKLWDEVLDRSPLVRTLRPVVRFELVLKVSP